MTIALGILTKEAVVLAADTEQTNSYLKISGTKVFSKSVKGGGAIAVTGSGTSGYIEALSQRLTDAFSNSPSIGIEQLETTFRREIKTFFADHVIPCAVLQSPPESCDLVLAVERNGQRRLWITTHNALHRRDVYATIGMGGEYADALLRRVLNPQTINIDRIDRKTAERIATYAVFLVKASVKYCGMGTDVVSLAGGNAIPLDAGVLSILEYHFGGHFDLQALALQYVVGYPFVDDKKALRKLTNYFKSLQSSITSLANVVTASEPWALE